LEQIGLKWMVGLHRKGLEVGAKEQDNSQENYDGWVESWIRA